MKTCAFRNKFLKVLGQFFAFASMVFFSIGSIHAQSTADTTILIVDGAAASASINAGDNDWFKFITTTSGIYIIETHGSTDTYMYLFQSNGTTQIDFNDDGGSETCSKISQDLSANTWYYIKIRGYDSATTGDYTLTVTGPSTTMLYSPRYFSGIAGDGSATLSWTVPASGTPNGYKIYWSYTENGTFTALSNTYTTTSATVSLGSNSSDYWFYATAIYTTGESVPSNKVNITPQTTNQEIVTLVIDGSATSASLTANENDWFTFKPTVTGLHTIETHGTTDTYMTLYESDKTTEIDSDDDGGITPCSKINSYLNANTWYYIMVRGYNTSTVGNYTIDIAGPGTTTLSAPLNLIATIGNGSASFSWDLPASGTPNGYKLYRSSTENGTYSPLTYSYTTRSATVTGLNNGTTYWFYVTAIYPAGESTNSNKVSVVPGTVSQGFTDLIINGSAANASLTADSSHWYRFSPLGSGTHIIETHGTTDTYMTLYQSDRTTVIENDDDGGTNNCSKITRTLTAGSQYFVKINGYGSSTTGDYTIDVKGPTATTLSAPGNLIGIASDGGGTISWGSPASGSPSSYKLYQSTSENGTYTALTSTYTTTSALLSGLSNGITYWYYVTAIYSTGESSGSNKINITPTSSTPGITTLVVDGSAVSANFIANGNNLFKFYTTVIGTHSIETHGTTDTYMTLYQSDQTTEIQNDDDGGAGSNSKISSYLSPNLWYYIKVRGYDSGTSGSYTIDVVGPGSVTLNAPRNLTATAGDGTATLTWYEPTSGIPTSYRVYRSTSENGTYSPLSNTYSNRAAVVTGLSNATTYWFYVTAVYPTGESASSNKVSVTPVSATLNPPLNLTSIAGDQTIALSWNGPVSGSPTGYKLYQSTSENGTYTSLSGTYTTLSATLSGLTNGTIYWYYITAIYSTGESTASNKVSGTPVSASSAITTLAINGTAVSASLIANDNDLYKFYTLESGNHSIETHGSTDTYMILYQSDETTVISENDDGGSANCSKITWNLNSGGWYFVKVRGFNPSVTGNYTIDITGPASTTLYPPRDLSAYPNNSSATFNWTEPLTGTPTGYKLYQSSSENGTYSPITNTYTNRTATVTGLTNGIVYWFYATAVYANGESTVSNKISVTPGVTPQGATTLIVGADATFATITTNDNDWYWFVPSVTGIHNIETYGTTDTHITLYEGDQTTEITSNDDGGFNTCSKITWNLNAGSWYFVKVRGYDVSTTGNYTIDVKGPSTTTVSPPTSLTAIGGNGVATISWSEPVSGTPTGYRLYRSSSENGNYSPLSEIYTLRSTTVTSLTNGTTYWFYATAIYTSGESVPSIKVSVTPSSTIQGITTLTINSSAANASLTGNDNDWYKFYPSITGTHIIETHGSTDTYMILYQSDQTTVIDENDDGGIAPCSRISTTLSANTWYYIKIRGYSTFTLGDYTIDVRGPGSTTLNPPRYLSASAGNGSATLTWSEPVSGIPTGYKLYQSTSENGTYTLLSNTYTSRSATVSGLNNGTTYWFYATAIYSTGESAISNKISITPSSTSTAIITLTVNSTATSASLIANDNDWYKFYPTVSGTHVIETHGSTDTYMILYQSDQTTVIGEDDDGGITPCSRVSGNLNANTWYFVKIRGFSPTSTGNYSIDVIGPGTTVSNPPRYLTASSGNGSVTFSWSEPSTGTPTGYRLYQSSSEYGTYMLLSGVFTSRSATISGLNNGTTYWFYATAVYSTGESAASNKVNSTPSTASVYPPQNLATSAGDGVATFSWSAPATGTPTSYKLYQSSSENGTYMLSGTYTSLSASLTGLTNGTTYWYYITALYSTGESSGSNKVNVTPSATNQGITTLTVNGSTVNASIVANDNDWYKFYTSATGTHVIETHGSTDTYMTLYQSDQTTVIDENDDGGVVPCSKISRYLNANTWYFVKIRGYYTTTTGNYSIDIIGPTTSSLNPPQNLVASAGDGIATFSWAAPATGTPTGYKLYQSSSENGTYSLLNSTYTTRLATVTGLSNGITYWFYITAIYSTGESTNSNKVSVTPSSSSQGITTLIVDGSAVNASLTANDIDWYRFTPSATGIHTIETHGTTDTYMTLYQSDQTSVIENDDDGGTGTSSRISSNLSANILYYIKVRGYSTSTTGSYTIDVEGPATTALNPPRNLVGSATNGGATLTWDSPSSGSPTGYRLYQSTSENGTYTALSGTYNEKTASLISLSNGTTYWFYTTAIYPAGESTQSNKISVTPVSAALNPPRNLTALTGNGEATFSWLAPLTGTPTGYKLYWSSSENGTYTPWDRTYTTNTATIAILSNGSAYWFYVTAIYSSGESSASNKVSVTLTSLQSILSNNESEENKSTLLSPTTYQDIEMGTELKIYPNPFNNIIRINNKNNQKILSITIYDVNGKLVFQQKGATESVNTSKLKKGHYTAVIQTNDKQMHVFKLIKSGNQDN